MKLLLTVIMLLCLVDGWAVCSSPISRTNNSPNTVLTATKLNTDFNTVYSKVNNLPGDCITDGTVTFAKLDSTSLAPILKGLKEGCKVTRSDANTLAVGKCLLANNGSLVETTSSTTVTWGCSGCTAEANATRYYLYSKQGSSLDLLISTTAPGTNGYNGTSRVLARFYNNTSGDIDQYSIDQWHVNEFLPQNTGWVDFPSVAAGTLITATTTSPGFGTTAYNKAQFRRNLTNMEIRWDFRQTAAGTAGSGMYLFNLLSGYAIDTTLAAANSSTSNTIHDSSSVGELRGSYGAGATIMGHVSVYSATQLKAEHVQVNGTSAGQGVWGSANVGFNQTAYMISIRASVPIAGWEK